MSAVETRLSEAIGVLARWGRSRRSASPNVLELSCPFWKGKSCWDAKRAFLVDVLQLVRPLTLFLTDTEDSTAADLGRLGLKMRTEGEWELRGDIDVDSLYRAANLHLGNWLLVGPGRPRPEDVAKSWDMQFESVERLLHLPVPGATMVVVLSHADDDPWLIGWNAAGATPPGPR